MRNAAYVLVVGLFFGVAFLVTDAVGSPDTDMFSQPGRFVSDDGAFLYKQNCLSCHMEEGKGVHTGAGMYPKLGGNPAVEMPSYTTGVIVHGLNGMPSFDTLMTDEQIAAVSNFLAKNYGNRGSEQIDAAAVKDIRPSKPVVYIYY